MPESADVDEVSTVEDVVRTFHLAAVRFHRLEGVWDEAAEADDGGAGEGVAGDGVPDADHPIEIQAELRGKVDAHDTSIEHRMRLSMALPKGGITVEVSALFEAGRPVRVAEHALAMFGRDVASTVVLPYLRQAVTDLSVRLGIPPIVMPIMGGQDLTFEGDPMESASSPQD